MKSSFLSLATKDWLHALFMAVAGAVLGYLKGVSDSGNWGDLNWQSIWQLAAGAAIAYLIKKFFTNSKDELLKKEDDTTKP